MGSNSPIQETEHATLTISNRILKGPGVVLPLIFPKVPQSSRPESLGFPSYLPPPLEHPPTLKNPTNIQFSKNSESWDILALHINTPHRIDWEWHTLPIWMVYFLGFANGLDADSPKKCWGKMVIFSPWDRIRQKIHQQKQSKLVGG